MYNNQYLLDNLTRQKDRIDDMIKSYQQAPVNNFISTGQIPTDLYEMKILNENDEVENIAIFKDTIFIGEDRMQIKKIDGTIIKYEIKKTYPRDKKDDKIDELNKKIQELEMRLNEPTTIIEPTKECNEPYVNDDEFIKPTTKAGRKSISSQE